MKSRTSTDDLDRLLTGPRLLPPEQAGKHLSDGEFIGYLMVSEHLASCPQCNEEMNRLAEAAEAWRTPQTEERRLALLLQIKEAVSHAEPEGEQFPRPVPVPENEPATYEPSVSVRRRALGTKRQAARPAEHLTAIDVGSSKVAVLIGKRGDRGEINIVGKGIAPNRGIRKGNVVNVEAAVDALEKAIEEAEAMSGVEVSRAYVGIAGADIQSFNARGAVAVARKDGEVTRHDVERALDAAETVALPPHRKVLAAIPQEFVVDERGGIGDPLGLVGSRLEVLVHLVTGSVTGSNALLTCVNRAGIEVVEMVFQPLATAEAVLTEDECELGCLLIDIGAGTTEYALFAAGEIRYSAVVPIGARNFTNDLAMILRTPFGEAERIKLEYGCCLPNLITDAVVSVPPVTGGAARLVSRKEVCEILEPRASELLGFISADLSRQLGEAIIPAGLVLTGGGARLGGLLELAEHVFDTRGRHGLPRGLGGAANAAYGPAWSTAAGLLLFARNALESASEAQSENDRGAHGVMEALRGMFSGLLAPR
jgi:cell division protein FtsA